jgi:hypothetical protein
MNTRLALVLAVAMIDGGFAIFAAQPEPAITSCASDYC